MPVEDPGRQIARGVDDQGDPPPGGLDGLLLPEHVVDLDLGDRAELPDLGEQARGFGEWTWMRTSLLEPATIAESPYVWTSPRMRSTSSALPVSRASEQYRCRKGPE